MRYCTDGGVHDLAAQNSEVQFETLNNLAVTALQAGFFDASLAGFDFVIQPHHTKPTANPRNRRRHKGRLACGESFSC